MDCPSANAKHSPVYYAGADAVIVAFDITNKASLEETEEWISHFFHFNPEKKDANIILVGTKADKRENCVASSEQMTTEDETEPYLISSEEITAYRANSPYFIDAYIETSAKNKTNVDAAFEKTTEIIFNRVMAPEEAKKKQELKKDLCKYIARIERYKNQDGKTNFSYRLFSSLGFWSVKSQELNRKANYKLAKRLLKELEDNPSKPLAEMVNETHVRGIRDSITTKIVAKDENQQYAERGIKSNELNRAIERAGYKK